MTNNSIKKNTVFNMIKSVSSIIFPLISFPYASRVLLSDGLGKVNFSSSIVSYFSLLAGLGIATYAIRECSKYKDRKEELEIVASQLYTINIITTLFAYLLLGVILLFTQSLQNYIYLIILQSTTIALTTVGADWINNVMEDFKFITLRTVAFQVISLMLLIAFVKQPSDYLIYATITVVSNGGANIINLFYRRKYCKLRITFNLNLRQHMTPILLLFSILIAQTIYANSSITLLGLFKGDSAVGLYSASTKIYNIIQTLVNSVTFAILPQLSFWFEKKDYKNINLLLRYGLNYTIVIGLPCVVGLFCLSDELIFLVAGPQYSEASASLRILSIALGASFLTGFVSNMIMMPSGRDRLCMISSVLCAMVNLILNWMLIPKWGIEAAAFSILVAQILGFVVKYPFIEKEIDYGNMKTLLVGPIIGSFFIVVISFVVKCALNTEIYRCLVAIPLCILIYIIILIIVKNDLAMSVIIFLKNRR